MKNVFRQGVILLQTLVVCVLMSMMGVMVLKWVTARYVIVSKEYKTSVAKTRTEGCSAKIMSNFSLETKPTSISSDCKMDGIIVTPTLFKEDVSLGTVPSSFGSAQKLEFEVDKE